MMNSNNLIAKCAFSYTSSATLVLLMSSSLLASAILVQPNNYMLDDSPMIQQHDSSGSLSPFYNDAHNGAEQQSDKDIVNIIGDSLARLRLARMLDQQQQQQQQQQDNQEGGQLSQEMADLIQSEQQQQQQAKSEGQDQSLSSSVASMLMNVAQAAAAAASSPQGDDQMQAQGDSHDSTAAAAQTVAGQSAAQRGPVMELDTTQPGGQNSASMPSKSDLKQSGPIQWYNPKETIPVLKISSMATPSKYKKVYFRSEKKLVDGAFHSPSGTEQSEKKTSLVKPFAGSQMAGVQRRSSRGSSASAPPSVLQDGVLDFLKKFRDVYVQTRPGGSASPSSPINLSSVIAAAASSPFASILAPGSGGSRPNFASALSAAGQMVNSAAMLSQAASPSTSGSSGSQGAGGASGTAGTAGTAAGTAAGAASTPNKSPLSTQSYVSFWSKTFPTWVRKMLKQMRRRSLYNSSKRHQHQHQHQHASGTAVSQKASGANVVDSPGASNSGSSSSMSSGSN